MDVEHRLTQGKLERSEPQPVASSSFLTDSASSNQGLKPPVPASSSSSSHLPPTPPRSNPPLTAAPPSPPNPSNEPPAQVSSSSDPNAFTPYTRPSHLYPVPGGSIVRSETHEPKPIAGPSKSSSSSPPPPSSRNQSSPSPPPPSLSPPLLPPPLSSSKFTKRDPYEEAKLLVQNTNTTFIKPEPVDVKLEPDVDVRVKLESEMDVDSSESLGVKPDPEMDVDSCISLGAKPEPMDTSIPQEAFDRYMSHISMNANVGADVRANADSEPANGNFDSASVSRAQSHSVRVKTEPGGEHGVLAESVRVKPEPVENGISEDLFDLYMRHQHQHQRESSRDDMSLDEEGSGRVKREPELKSEEEEDEGEGVGRVGQQGSARVKREPEFKPEEDEDEDEGVGRVGQQGQELTSREQISEPETVRVKPEPVDNNHNLSNTRGRNTFTTQGSGSKGKRWRAERTDAVDGRMHERNDGSSGPGSMSNAHRGPHQNPRPIKRGNGDKHDWSSGERKRQRVEQWVKNSGGAGKKRKG
ncbi:hypothetical protein K435DRAFT_523795 [Dendrothele bispora CBS 962.96]|uniref:Uncharacterized protein n=1 Tax=Dendrothele bispora (strain CBS 962.96) TaxID=1314807 RepID=A0A4S8KUW5_DENBC|nr:hypothetical protein K435DRAFT_523795 [Dendrothele bispora CBS 962.96]